MNFTTIKNANHDVQGKQIVSIGHNYNKTRNTGKHW